MHRYYQSAITSGQRNSSSAERSDKLRQCSSLRTLISGQRRQADTVRKAGDAGSS